MLLLSFAPAIILLQFCFNPLYKIYSLECISEPACFSLKYIKYCISCITVYTYTIKKRRNGFPFRRRLSKNPGVDKGLQPLMFNPALTTQGELPRRGKRRPPGGCASERMKTQRFSYFAGFAARERMREAKPEKLKKVAFSHFFDTLKAFESLTRRLCNTAHPNLDFTSHGRFRHQVATPGHARGTPALPLNAAAFRP